MKPHEIVHPIFIENGYEIEVQLSNSTTFKRVEGNLEHIIWLGYNETALVITHTWDDSKSPHPDRRLPQGFSDWIELAHPLSIDALVSIINPKLVEACMTKRTVTRLQKLLGPYEAIVGIGKGKIYIYLQSRKARSQIEAIVMEAVPNEVVEYRFAPVQPA